MAKNTNSTASNKRVTLGQHEENTPLLMTSIDDAARRAAARVIKNRKDAITDTAEAPLFDISEVGRVAKPSAKAPKVTQAHERMLRTINALARHTASMAKGLSASPLAAEAKALAESVAAFAAKADGNLGDKIVLLRASKALEAGQKVRFLDKHTARYEDVITTDTDLTIVRVTGSRLVIADADNTRVVVPAAHVRGV